MGTRHLICVVQNESFKLAQYGQWDGYPEGQGQDILTFLKERYNPEAFAKGLSQLYEPSFDSINELYRALGINPDSPLISTAESNRIRKAHPSLLRATGANILDMIQAADKPLPTRIATEFAADSLFCEWAYVIDLDEGFLEVYKGYNREPLAETERFAFLDPSEDHEFHPVKFQKKWPLASLPSFEEFMSTLEPAQEES